MKFAALSYRGKIPRFFALGFVNKVMFHFEESVGVLTLLPNMALVKLPCIAFKVYMPPGDAHDPLSSSSGSCSCNSPGFCS